MNGTRCARRRPWRDGLAPTAALLLGLWVGGCAQAPVPPSPADAGAASLGEDWKPYLLPGKRPTDYRVTSKDGRWAIEARAESSASMLRRALDIPVAELGEVEWTWMVDAPLPEASLGDVDRTDAPARLVFAFDGDRSRLSPRNRMMFDLARALTGEEPPYATLVYAWSTHEPLETVVHNPRTDRIRKIVVDSGAAQARRWRHHRRHLAADYQRVFGEAPGRLIGVALMTDSDNTRSRAQAWYGRIRFHKPAPPACQTPQGSSCSSPKS